MRRSLKKLVTLIYIATATLLFLEGGVECKKGLLNNAEAEWCYRK